MTQRKTQRQKGSALVYILIAIALLAALTATFMDSSSQQTSSQNAIGLVSEMSSQIGLIRSAVEECVFGYPEGDITMPPNPVGGQQPVRPYPLSPTNSYLASPSADAHVKNIRCPGNPGNSNNHARIFGGNSGKFLPPPPRLFQEWIYYNNHDGVFLWTTTNKTDSYIDTALSNLNEKYSACELQYINNPTGGAAVSVASTAGWTCPGGHKCVVVRLITTPSAIYPGETGCP